MIFTKKISQVSITNKLNYQLFPHATYYKGIVFPVLNVVREIPVPLLRQEMKLKLMLATNIGIAFEVLNVVRETPLLRQEMKLKVTTSNVL